MRYYSDIEYNDSQKVDESIKIIKSGLNPKSTILQLFEVIKNAPKEYVYKFQEGRKLYVKFWDRDEMTHFSMNYADASKYDEIVWLSSAYPRAYYWIGFAASNSNQHDKAIIMFNSGQEIEPTNPLFLIGMGHSYNKMGNYKISLECYSEVSDVNEFTSPKIKAVALRGEGVQLIELKRLEEAKIRFYKSLEYDPNNEIAINELMYIDELQKSKMPVIKRFLTSKTVINKNVCIYCNEDKNEGVLRNIGKTTYFICSECYEKQNLKNT